MRSEINYGIPSDSSDSGCDDSSESEDFQNYGRDHGEDID